MLSRLVDRLTRRWVVLTGRRVNVQEDIWLQGPVGDSEVIGDVWLSDAAGRLGATIGPEQQAGLLRSIDVLAGAGFSPDRLAPAIRDFYERTSSWRLEVQARWSPWAWPFGWLVTAVFARRLQQLALPLRRRDAGEMTSTVIPLLNDGQQVAALWLRRLRSTGTVVYSGLYDTVHPAGAPRALLRVCFPLPHGRLVVLLEADVTASGGLRLSSAGRRWGDAGAYLVVERARGTWARSIPLHESFDIVADPAVPTALTTDHHLRLGAAAVLHLRYRMTPSAGTRLPAT